MKDTLPWVAWLFLVGSCLGNFRRDEKIDALEHDSVKFYRILYGPLDGGR